MLLRPRPACLLAACLALPLLLSCGQQASVTILSPVHGAFVTGTHVTVSGQMTEWDKFFGVQVNGIAVPLDDTFQVDVPIDPAAIFNRITVEGATRSGAVRRHTIVIVAVDGTTSDFVVDGDFSSEGVALRLADTGLGQITPIVESLSTDALDVSDLITSQNPIAQGSFSGISYTANVVEVGFGGFGLSADAMATGLDTDIQIDDFFLEVDLDLGWLGSCTLEIETAAANLTGSYDLSPLAADPSYVDVSLVSAVGVQLSGFTSQFVSGICDDPLIGDIVNLIIGQGQIQQLMQDGFEQNLADPDGSGPLDSPLAAAIETALAGVSIAGPVGEAVGGMLDAPIVSIAEELDGTTILADAAIFATQPHPDAPDLPASYGTPGVLPPFGATTPVGGVPYGMAFAISNSAMNQLLKTQIENGLLRQELTEFLGLPLTAGVLALAIPSFGVLPPSTPLVIGIEPTLAPVFTGNPGPSGEFAELRIGALEVNVRAAGSPQPILGLQVGLNAGLDLAFTTAGLEFSLATPPGNELDIVVTRNTLEANEAQLVFTFQNLFPLFAPELENAIDAFPVPSLLGLELEPLEVAQLGGGYIGLFANLVQTPTTTLQNVVFTDLSSGDFRQQGGCWLREWRHRLSGAVFGNLLTANLRGMLGADAGCTTNDATSSATLAYRIEFDVVSVPGEVWSIDVDHALLGTLDRISDGYNDGIGFQDGGGSAILHTDMQADYTMTGGFLGSFGFTPSVTTINDGIGGCSCDQNVEFSGNGGVTLNGSGDASITLDFAIDLETFSNSKTAFPTANGDEMAIRLGKNDTIDNNFTAGGYPGMGSRNIADDGHFVTVELTTSPAP
ncbi:MAG: hypothetical protein ACQGVC_05475 [Myxococcota bacterium]